MEGIYAAAVGDTGQNKIVQPLESIGQKNIGTDESS